MNTLGHFRLAALAIGVCLVLPAYSRGGVVSESDALLTKTYVINNWKDPSLQDSIVAIAILIDKNGYMFSASAFNLPRSENSQFLGQKNVKEVPIEQVPIVGLLELASLWPGLYPEIIPAVLSNSNPQVVAAHVPADRFKALSDEQRSQIPAEDLAELDNLYG